MTPQQISVIKGCVRMGATIEEICFHVGVDGLELEIFLNNLKSEMIWTSSKQLKA